MVEAQLMELATAVQSVHRDELLVNGRWVLIHGTSGGFLSSMAQTAHGERQELTRCDEEPIRTATA